jgi:hypothetical protein
MSAIDELNNPLMFDCFKCADATYNFFKKHNLTSQVYSYFFQTLNYGIKWFTSEHYEQIAGIIVNLLKDKPNIVIDNAYFIVNNERYLMKDEVFRIIKEKFK